MNKKLINLILISIFAALSFVSLFIQIPMPSVVGQQMIHFGNAITIMIAIIFGGWIGGLAGAIGMTLYDVMNPIYISSAPKTFILKLGIGLVAGFVFYFLNKKEKKNVSNLIIMFGVIFLAIGTTSLITSTLNDGVILINSTAAKTTYFDNQLLIDVNELPDGEYYFKVGNDKYHVDLTGFFDAVDNKGFEDGIIKIDTDIKNASYSEKFFKFHWATIIFPIILGSVLLLFVSLSINLPYTTMIAGVAAISAVLFNIVGEFIGKVIMQLIIGQGFEGAIINALISLPATIINASVSVLVIIILFPQVYNAFTKSREEKKELA